MQRRLARRFSVRELAIFPSMRGRGGPTVCGVSGPTYRRYRFIVREEDQGLRLDQVLAARVPGLSRRKARVLLELGGVFVDGLRVKVAGRAVRAKQAIVANIGGSLLRASKEVGSEARAKDEADLPAFQVVYEDAEIVVVDKPAGLLTAPTPESDRGNLAWLLGQSRGEIFVVHRLDLGTSGLLVFARTKDANRLLSERVREHDFERVYTAVLEGNVGFEEQRIEAPVDGKRAVTEMRVLERLPVGASVVQCVLTTGRTHQIRIHAQGIGHPVLGDKHYGQRVAFEPPRMALHATRLGIDHPSSGERMVFESALPEDLSGWLERLRADAGADTGVEADSGTGAESGA